MNRQFDVAAHYDIMAELDRDVHDNQELSLADVEHALALMRTVPRSVFLPCFGTGRHIQPLLDAGVQRIVGVDLSPVCVEKAQRFLQPGCNVHLEVADLLTWKTDETFDAVLLLGNSYGDIIDRTLNAEMTRQMLLPLKVGGAFVMDYVGRNYEGMCHAGQACSWPVVLNGQQATDTRTPSFDPNTRVMTISVTVSSPGATIWEGKYQKLVLGQEDVKGLFVQQGVSMTPYGMAKINHPFHQKQFGGFGMLAAADWWIGRKTS